MTYRNVIVGTDGSPTAEVAVRQAAELATEVGARLVVVTAFRPVLTGLVSPADTAPEELRWQLTDRAEAEAKARVGRGIAREAGASEVVVQTVEGDPADVVLEVAGDFLADLIVVGSKGLSSPAHFVLGSVASSVAHHAPCDVLIVHTTD